MTVKIKKRQVIDTTFDEYANSIIEEFMKYGINMKIENFRGEYYNKICEELNNGNGITKRVYDNIPDLHYWINKHFIIHGNNVIVLNTNDCEVIALNEE